MSSEKRERTLLTNQRHQTKTCERSSETKRHLHPMHTLW